MGQAPDTLNWDMVVDLYYQSIFAFTVQFLGSRDEANDATQETFLKALRSKKSVINQLPNSHVVKYWLYRIARNVCIDRKRWYKRLLAFRKSIEFDELVEEERPISKTLKTLIAELPTKQREVFILRQWHGFSTEETANLLKIDPGTVKSHLSRAISRLKTELVNREIFKD